MNWKFGSLIVWSTLHMAVASDQAAGQIDAGTLTLSGRVHRVVMLVEDGASWNGFFMDSEQGYSMLRADATKRQDGDWIVSGALEVAIQSNPAIKVSQDDPNPGTDITVRFAELVIEHAKFGKAGFGRLLAAAWVVPELDLSGTVPSATLANGALAPGMKFVDRSTNGLSNIQVLDYFIAGERLLVTDGIRYDSPRFGGGGQLSGTLAADARWDAALRYYPKDKEWSIRAAATYQHKPLLDIEHRGDLGLSVRHNGTGLSLTGGLARGRAMNDRLATGWILKAGWLKNIIPLGATALSIDHSRASDVVLAGDVAESTGLFAQQTWESVKMVFYVGYRTYDVTRPDISLKRLHTFTTGAMISF